MTTNPRLTNFEHSDIRPGDVVSVPEWLAKAMNPEPTNNRSQACPHCGQRHIRDSKRTCNAHSKRAVPKRPCLNFPPAGLPVCRLHGGAAPQVEKRGEWLQFERGLLAVAGEVTREAMIKNPYVILPAKRPKRGGHKNKNSRSAVRAKRQQDSLSYDRTVASDTPAPGADEA